MDDNLLEAREALKRLEHIIYVTLKYTRTVDVLINGLKRLVNCFDFIIEALLERAKSEDLIAVLPKSPGLRANQLGELFPENKELQKYLSFYACMKITLNSQYEKRQEYRRHVTMIVQMENSTCEVDIDSLENYEKFAHGFFGYAGRIIEGKKEED